MTRAFTKRREFREDETMPGMQNAATDCIYRSYSPLLIRTAGTYIQCRRDDGHEGRHHASGITWAAGKLPGVRYELCGDPACCRWPEHLVPYLGVSARTQR